MDWARFANPQSSVCPTGPDLIFHSSGAALAAASWGESSRASNPEQLVHPDIEGWNDLYVRTAVVRPSGWKPGARGPVVKKVERVVEILEHLGFLDHERTVSLLLDDKWKLIGIHEASVGGLHGCALLPRDVLRVPVLVGATRMIMAHNHPSGDPRPSNDDVEMTKTVALAAQQAGIQFVDHFTIAAGRKYQSISAYAAGIGVTVHARRLPPRRGADVVFRDPPTDPARLATRPYGKYARFVVRTATVQSQTRGLRSGPRVSSFETATLLPAVQELSQLSTDAIVTICLSGANQVLAINVRVADPHEVGVRSVFGVATSVPTSAVVVAHNHPGGTAIPTQADRDMTERIGIGLRAIGTPLLDHLLIGRGRVESLGAGQ